MMIGNCEPLENVAKMCARILRDAAGCEATGSYIIVHYDEKTKEITSDWLLCETEEGPIKLKKKIKEYLNDMYDDSFFIEFQMENCEDGN